MLVESTTYNLSIRAGQEVPRWGSPCSRVLGAVAPIPPSAIRLAGRRAHPSARLIPSPVTRDLFPLIVHPARRPGATAL